MAAQVQFCVVDMDGGARVGKLSVPHRKSADWLNFLVSPKQQVQIVFAEGRRGGLDIYFQADERLYSYLTERLTHQPVTDELKVADSLQPLAAIAN